MGTGTDPKDPQKRLVRINGQTVQASRLLEHMRLVWLTPAQDRLFIEARAERLRFFDRLVYAAFPAHALHLTAYEKALRERLKLLIEGEGDRAWLEGLEGRLAQLGLEIIEARRQALKALQDQINSHQGAFPKADLSLSQAREDQLNKDWSLEALQTGFERSRARDRAASRSLFGPHRWDLDVVHRLKQRPASDCSTGEQKALILNLILAQGARLSQAPSKEGVRGAKPIVLLDEVAAHLDPERRHALFDETTYLGLQTFFTGTDAHLFDGLRGRALGVRVELGQLIEFN